MKKSDKKTKLTKEEFYKYTNEKGIIGDYWRDHIFCKNNIDGTYDFGFMIENEYHLIYLETVHDLKTAWKLLMNDELIKTKR